MIAYMPWFGWLGIAAILGFVISVGIIYTAKKKRNFGLRKYHVAVAGTSLLLAMIHGIYALMMYL